MKSILHFSFAFLLICITISSDKLFGQSKIMQDESNGYEITTGERPPFDLKQLPTDAWKSGLFKVKFTKEQGKNINEASFQKGADGFLVTGVEDFDQLSKQFKVTSGRSMLSALYEIPGKQNEFKERHQAWGFDLWYVFTTDYTEDMIQLVEAFKQLESVEIAELQLKIRRIEPVGKQPLPNGSGQNNPKWTPDDPFFNLQWNLDNTGQTVFGMPGTEGADIHIKKAWDLAKGNPDVVVAVFDAGIKYNHEDLVGNIWPGIGPDGNSTVADDHATAVAGIIAAVNNNTTGIAGIAGGSGANDGARLMSLDILKTTPSLSTMAAYIYATDNGAAVAQNSWSYNTPNSYNTDDLYGIDYFNANGGGTVMTGGIVFFAAGNDNDNQNWYPGAYSGTVAVAGTDNNDRRVYFSTYGDYVELSAAGLNVLSTGFTGVTDDYYYNSGTSFSSPQASGLAAQMLSMAPGKLSPQQLRGIMKATADNIDYLNPDVAGQMGTGRLNASDALKGVKDLLDGIENPQTLSANAAGPVSINLSWTKNSKNHDVMLVFATDNVFGTPANGTTYSPGNTLSGGGTVLYRGSANTFMHNALEPNTVYFYRAFSYNSSNQYSSGKKTNAKTEAAYSSDATLHETFEADSPTRSSWTQVQEAGSGNWTFAAGSSAGSITTAYKGLLNARFVSTSGTNTPITKLISPAMDISGLSYPELDFWYGQELWSPDQNELKVYYRVSAMGAWTEIAHYTGNVSSWTEVTLSLPNPSSTYQIAFEGINNYGRANVVDEVIVGEGSPSVTASYSAGDISTDYPPNHSGVSSCPGSLTVTIPAGAVITGTDVEYDMTAASAGWMSEQMSRLTCTSTGGKYETMIYSGVGDATGTYNYNRSGLDIANEVAGGGTINFELHALRTYEGSPTGCSTTDNKVNNNTWKVTVHYFIPKPAILYSPLAATTSSVGNRNLDEVHISTTHPNGIDVGSDAPRIYWRVNAGSWQSAVAASVSGNLYDFVIGTTGLSNNDVIDYFVIAQSVSGDLVAQPGTGLVATDVNTISTYPTDPYSYTIVAGPLAGDYDISPSKFNQLTGRNITFEKVVNKVVKEIWVADEENEPAPNPSIATKTSKEALAAGIATETSSRTKGSYKMMEVEEISYQPMENGKVYTGSLYVENPDKSKGTRGIYATLTAAVADLNSLGVSAAVNFLLTEASYSAGETFPLTINVVSENRPDAGKPVTIKPGASKTVSISGAVNNGAIFQIINTNNVVIDGSNSGGSDRSLTIANTSTTVPEVISIGSSGNTPVHSVGAKNCNLNNGSQTSSAVAVTADDGTDGYFNDITIQNNSIQKAYIGVYARAAVAPGNGSGLLIADNALNASSTNSIRLIGIYVQGVDGATVENNTVANISNTNNELLRGIQFAAGTNGTISGNTITSLTMTNTGTGAAISGIYLGSGAAAKSVSVSGNTISQLINSGTLAGFSGIINFTPNVEITGNTIQTMTQNGAVSFWGIVCASVNRVVISDNEVKGLTTATTGIPNGINIQGASTGVSVFNNKISNIKNTNTGGYSSVGLALSSTSTVANVLVYNNFIWDVAGYGYNSTTTDNGYGIRITTGGGYRLYNNTVHLATNQTATTGIPACLMIASGIGADALDIRNNIFSMAATVGTNRCAVICNSANTVFSTIDYNDYYQGTGTRLGYIGSYRNTIATWRTGTGQDVNSIAVNPGFVSATDLHLSAGFSSPVANMGTSLGAVLDDIDGDLRSSSPFIGADEFGRSWTGSVSTVWNNSSNWTGGIPSAATETVKIPSGVPNFPAITVAATCGYLLIDEGAEVKIAPGGSLTVAEKLINNAGKDKLVIQSDNTGTGSLLHYSNGIDGTVERYLPAAGYHLVSIPVTQTSNPVSGWFKWSYLYQFDVATQLWSAMGTATETPLNVNKGYMIYKYFNAPNWQSDTTYAFQGTLNSGTFYADVTFPNTSTNQNLVPNPYPSAIDWNAAAGWTKTNIGGSYWMWIHSANNYGVWNGATGTHGVTKDIPVGQSFFVEAAANPALSINNKARVHSAQSFYKEKEELSDLLRIKCLSNGYSDELVALFDDNAAPEYNNQEDATKMYGGEDAPQIYSMSTDAQKLTINMLPLSMVKMEIPVGFELSVEGDVTFVASAVESFDPEVNIHLLDKITGTLTNLRTSPAYSFYHHPDDPADRFDLVLNSNVGIIEASAPEIGAYFHDGWLYLNVPEDIYGSIDVNLLNVNGQLVYSNNALPGQNSFAIPNLSSGVYLIRLVNEHFIVTKKAINR